MATSASSNGETLAMQLITELEVAGYRSLREATWKPGKLNLVIGPNASGKSNLLKALEFLSAAAKGKLSERVRQEGGATVIQWDGRAKSLEFKVSLAGCHFDSDYQGSSLEYQFRAIPVGSYFSVEREQIVIPADGSKGLARILLDRTPGKVEFDQSEPFVQELPRGKFTEGEPILGAIGREFPTAYTIAIPTTHLGNMAIHRQFSTADDARVRGSTVTAYENELQPDGQNLVAVLHTLYESEKSRDFKDAVNDAMRAVFGPDFQELSFSPAADRRIQLRIRWVGLERSRSSEDISDGTLRFLYLLAILANPEPSYVIAIDEPELGLHPSMFGVVAEFAKEAAERTQVVLTTHSPSFLDAFSRIERTITVVDMKQGETNLRNLTDEELKYWLERYRLGELFRTGELEALK